MVQLPNSSKLRPDHGHPAGATAVKLEVEDALDDEHGPFHKRSKIAAPSPTPQFENLSESRGFDPGVRVVLGQDMYGNVLDEPSPLGLRLRKSPSLLDLIQMRLAQASGAALCAMDAENSEPTKKKEVKSTAPLGNAERLKASNFPANILRIGTWECISRYEGDLVAKCYFAKHKLVWEVLEGGLKNKIEIQWSDISALKATCPENGPGTLDIVLARPPLFFRETDPQPRKHTLWQATSDFTCGQASINRRHFLQCPSGLLGKNFEKLVQCDPRLNLLSQQPDIMLDSPYFEPRSCIFEDQIDTKSCHGLHNLKDDCKPSFPGFDDPSSPRAASSISTKSEAKHSVGKASEYVSQSANPGLIATMDNGSLQKNSSGAQDPKIPNWWDQLKVPGLRASMSVNDLVNHIGNCINEQMISGNPSLPSNSMPTKEILEDIAQYLLSDTQISSTSDETSLMARVNSLCCLLQKDPAANQMIEPKTSDSFAGEDSEFSDDELDSRSEAESVRDVKLPPISRKESFGELLMHLPRIASMPQFLFNISEDSENESR